MQENTSVNPNNPNLNGQEASMNPSNDLSVAENAKIPQQNTVPVQEVTPSQAQPQTDVPEQTFVQGQMATQDQVNNPPILPTLTNPAPEFGDKIWGALSYIPFVGFVALVLKPQSAFVRLHGRQGLLLTVLLLGGLFISLFFYMFLPAWFVFPLWSLFQTVLFIVSVYSLYQAFIGNWWKIPALGDVAEKIPTDMISKVVTGAIAGPVSSDEDTKQQ